MGRSTNGEKLGLHHDPGDDDCRDQSRFLPKPDYIYIRFWSRGLLDPAWTIPTCRTFGKHYEFLPHVSNASYERLPFPAHLRV